jgi:hypothetical protein
MMMMMMMMMMMVVVVVVVVVVVMLTMTPALALVRVLTCCLPNHPWAIQVVGPELLPVLVRFVHGSTLSKDKLVDEFLAANPGPSKKQVRQDDDHTDAHDTGNVTPHRPVDPCDG